MKEKTIKDLDKVIPKSIKFNFYAKNCTFDTSGFEINEVNLIDYLKVNFFSENCEDADELFKTEYECISDIFNFKIHKINKNEIYMDVFALWHIPLKKLNFKSIEEINRFKEQSETWNDMVSIYIDINSEIISESTIEELYLNIE